MSAPRPRIEVITGVERRRRWSWEQKRAIVEESLSAHASAAAIARKHGIGTGQLYTWRRQLLKRQLAGTPRFACVDVEVAAGSPRLTGPIADPAGGRTSVISIVPAVPMTGLAIGPVRRGGSTATSTRAKRGVSTSWRFRSWRRHV